MNKLVKEISIMILCVVVCLFGSYAFLNLEFMNSLANITSVFSGLGWFISLFVAATLFTAYLVIIAKTKFIVRFLAIPLWLIFTISTLVTIDQFLGYSYPIVPPKSQIISYRTYLDDESKEKMVETWVYLYDEDRTRSYRFQWSEEKEEKLKKGVEASNEGMQLEIELRNIKPEDVPDGAAEAKRVDHDIKHRGLPPKSDKSLEPNKNSIVTENDNESSAPISANPVQRGMSVQLPSGRIVEIPAGSEFKVSPNGEIEIIN